MSTKKAKTLTDVQITTAIKSIDRSSSNNRRDRLWVMLSCFAGLRAQEIAYLDVDDVLDAEGNISPYLQITKKAGKYGKERRLTMPVHLRNEVAQYVRDFGLIAGPMFWNQYRAAVTPNAVAQQLGAIYRKCGFVGASSHSGRRTLITKLARSSNDHGCSLLDVQHIAGHADVSSTMEYVDLSPGQAAMLNNIWSSEFNKTFERLLPVVEPGSMAGTPNGTSKRRAIAIRTNSMNDTSLVGLKRKKNVHLQG